MLHGVQSFLRSLASLLVVTLGATAASAQTAPAPAGSAPAPAPPPPPAAGTAPPPSPAGPPPAGAYPYPYPYPYGQYPYSPYPYAGYPPAARPAPKPRVLPYHEGQSIPPGYYLEDHIHRGLAIAGGAVLGGTYAISVSVAAGYSFTDRSGWLALPVAGPFITAATRHNTCNSSIDYSCTDDQSVRMFLTLDGLAQTAGAVLLIWGLNSHEKQLVREDAKYLVVMPTQVGSGYGLGVAGNL